ncbi:MAG: hypothetical protein IKG79_07415 [Neisseriaceae bacterium]|nr:hypothetical protein [Neisseriaceae bacterium]
MNMTNENIQYINEHKPSVSIFGLFILFLLFFVFIGSVFVYIFEDSYVVPILYFSTLFISIIILILTILLEYSLVAVNGWHVKKDTKKGILYETFAMYFVPLLFAIVFINMTRVPMEFFIYKSVSFQINAKEQVFKEYSVCQIKNCHQSFILDKDKFAKRTYQVDITDKCVTIKPVHNYDFLYYELKKCGDEITEKEYHSTAKFLKNVATLNFSSVFGQK